MVLRSTGTTIRALVADRASRLITAIATILVAGLTLIGAYLCMDLRDTAWRNAKRNADNLLALIEENVGRIIRTYQQTLQQSALLSGRPDVAALDPVLRRLATFDISTQASGLGGIAGTDAAGQVQITSDPNPRTRPNLGDLPEFLRHKADPAAGLLVTGPTASRASGRRILRLTRRIEAPDGAFAGIISGAIYLDYFQALFERLRIEEGNTINIFLLDGTLLVRAPPHPADVGQSIAAGAAYRYYRTHGRGHFVGHAQIDGKSRHYAFATLDDLSLIVTVATSTESIRAAWIYKAGIVATLILSLCAVTCGLAVLLQREVRRRAAAEESSREANAALSLLARTDGLTGLPNRRRYDEVIAAEWARAAAAGDRLALLIVDADHFKQFNDRFGHHRGDAVLRAVADCLRGTPGGGISCRLGGEEFAVILPGHSAETALVSAERVRRAVVNLQIAHAPEVGGGVATVSIGVACAAPKPGDTPDALFMAADAALYEAKSAGRNRVRAAPPLAPAEPRPIARRA